MLVLLVFAILLAIVGGKAGVDLIKGLLMLVFGGIFLLASCAIL